MKRFFALAALVLGLASCQTEPEGLDVQMGGAVDATITVNIPDSETRAGGTNSAGSIFDNIDLSGDATIRYILKIYQKVGDEYVASNDRQVEYSDGKSVVFPVRLVPNRDYRFVVWADYVVSEDDVDYHYNTEDLTNIKLKGEWKPMDETRDAFTGVYCTVEAGKQYTGTSSINILLKRPFAKLRVVTTDIKELTDLHITPAYATVEYTTEYRPAFNALAGTAKAVGTVKKAHSTVFPIAPYTNEANDEHKRTIFTDYFFAEEGDAVSFILDVYEDEAKTKPIKSNNFNTDIAINRNYLTTIQGNILTDGNNVKVTIDDAFDGYNNYVDSAALAQEVLDNAAANTTIYLEPGVNYGTLIFRQNASSTVVDITSAGGDAAGNEKYRRIENLTIIGAEGAVVDGFDFQVGWINGSGASYIDIENLTVKNVTFSGETTPFFFDGSKGSALGIDGLTIENCKMTDADNKDRLVFQQISGYKTLNDKSTNEYVMTAGVKNLTITNCEVTGAYMVIESRAMENLIITDNTFTGIKQRDMLITSDTTNHPNETYTGVITITGNTSIAGEERFIRGSLNNSDAVVIIKDNRIIDYKGSDADYIKVEGGNNVTKENNVLETTVNND